MAWGTIRKEFSDLTCDVCGEEGGDRVAARPTKPGTSAVSLCPKCIMHFHVTIMKAWRTGGDAEDEL